jgi:hypothetical protein
MKIQRHIGQYTVALSCSEYLTEQAEFVLDVIAGAIDRGEVVLRDGLRVEVSWSVLTMRQTKDRELHICEPDFDADPFTRLRDDITATLSVIAAQNEFLRTVGTSAVPVRFDHKVVIAAGVLELDHVYLERSKDVPFGDSGWYIGPVDEEAGKLNAIYVYQLLSARPEFMSVLALPPGHMVVFLRQAVESVVDERDREIWQVEPR